MILENRTIIAEPNTLTELEALPSGTLVRVKINDTPDRLMVLDPLVMRIGGKYIIRTSFSCCDESLARYVEYHKPVINRGIVHLRDPVYTLSVDGAFQKRRLELLTSGAAV